MRHTAGPSHAATRPAPRPWKRLAAVVAPTAAAAVVLGGVSAMTAGAAPALAADGFTRTVAGGWGTAETGGAWTASGAASALSVGSGAGALSVSPGKTVGAYLTDVASSSSEVAATLSFDRLPTGSGIYASVVARAVAGKGQYALVVKVTPTGAVSSWLVRRSASFVDTRIATAVALPGTYAAGGKLRVRVQATGTGPTKVVGRVWSAAAAEPTTWSLSATDSTAALQAQGHIGVSSYLSSADTVAVRQSVDDLAATTVGGAAPAPTTSSPAPSPTTSTPAPAPTPTVTTTPPPVDPVRPSDAAGSLPVGSARYPVPAGAVYVAPTGSDTNPGTLAAPVATVAKAVTLIASGGTIVLRAGTYHESVTLPANRPLTLQNYPGEAVWFDGTRVVTPVADGARWRVDGWATAFDHSPTYTPGAPDNTTPGWSFVSADYPLAAYPEQVWVGSTALRQVASLAAVTTGTFFYDSVNKRLYLGSNPTGQTVRSSDLQTAIYSIAPGSVLRGFGVRRYATSVPQMGTVRVVGAGSLVENVVITENATQGLYARASNLTIRRSTFTANGLIGMASNYADGLKVVGVKSTGNNVQRFNRAPVSGGIKVTRTRGVSVTASQISDNLGQGLWFDESSYDITVTGNVVTGNTGSGVVTELSEKVVIADNIVNDNVIRGIFIINTGNVAIWNNTLARNDRAIYLKQDARSQFNLSDAGHDPRQTLPDPTVPWSISNVTIRNNIFDNSRGNSLLSVEDQTKTRTAEQMKLTTNGNVYLRSSASAPSSAVLWASGAAGQRGFSSVATFRTATGQEATSLAQDGSGLPSPINATTEARTAQPLPSAVAALIGRPAGERHLGAYGG